LNIEKDDDFKSIIISCNNKMAFDGAKIAGTQINPAFAEGYPYPDKYMNMGQLMTPFEGKKLGQSGDYGHPQSTTYYSLENPVYPYPLDKYSYSSMCLPKMCRDAPYIPKYPWKYIPGNYFAPQDDLPDMKKVKTAQDFNTYPLGSRPDFHMDGDDHFPGGIWSSEVEMGKKERYGGNRSYVSTDMFLYRRLPAT